MLKYVQRANRSDAVSRDVEQIVASGRTPWQRYQFFRSSVHGMCVVLEDDIQSCESDEGIYHEALVHPALLLHPTGGRVLIMGGGEGATAREVLRHARVEDVVMVDIDRDFVELCKQHLPDWSAGAFEDKRLALRCEDINAYLAGDCGGFDVVVGDLVDVHDWASPVGALYGRKFYEKLKSRMADGGILAAQAGPLTAHDAESHRRVRAELQSCFAHVATYGIVVPSFYHLWGFVLASDAPLEVDPPRVATALRRAARVQGLELPAAGIDALGAAFAVPRAIASQWTSSKPS